MNTEQQIKYRLLRKQLSEEQDTLYDKVCDIEEFLMTERLVEKALFKISAVSSDKAGVIVQAGLKAIYGGGEESDFTRETGDKAPKVGGFLLAGAHGLGLSEVVAALLRLVAIKKKIGGVLDTLILDEALSNVDKVILPKVLSFIKMVGLRLGINILSISHRGESVDCADLIYKFKKVKTCTIVKKVALGEWGARKEIDY